MGKIMILNGSPRAPKSNSKRYAKIFADYMTMECDYVELTSKNHSDICSKIGEYTDVLIVFPLYADALPVGLLDFFKTLEANPPLASKPVISIFVNCGFLEYTQNEVAVMMIKLFCQQNNYKVGSIFMLGSGEAILDTPFRFMVTMAIKRLSKSVVNKSYKEFHLSMPLTKRLFILASNVYWTNYGKKNGIDKKQMQTMEIEGQL